jgi:Uma2 family endonuclease
MVECEMPLPAVSRRRANWTYADYCRIPADGRRHEILDGRHCVTPAPETYHQALVLAMASTLRARIDEPGRGQVFIAPTDVHLGPGTVVQPDILVVAASQRAIVGKAKIRGAPAVVVEVLSPSTRKRDRQTKLARYQRAGVAEYLIVDPRARVIEQYVLEGGTYGEGRRCTLRIELVTFPGVVLDLRTLW